MWMHPGAEHKCGAKVLWHELEAVAMRGQVLHLWFLKEAKSSKWQTSIWSLEVCWKNKCWLLNSNKTAASICISSWLTSSKPKSIKEEPWPHTHAQALSPGLWKHGPIFPPDDSSDAIRADTISCGCDFFTIRLLTQLMSNASPTPSVDLMIGRNSDLLSRSVSAWW